jgi:2,4-dienoyl-CoA reductase-like NADH-dependent reductase (Old Yellow Enzyme family)
VKTNCCRHGYLLTQFMSGRVNFRTDSYGGTAAKRVEIVLRIIKAIRAATSKDFCIGIKLNSADASIAGSIDETLEQIRLIKEAGIDFIEISGGTYEDPKMLEPDSSSMNADGTRKNVREAFFLEFSSIVRKTFPDIILMVTGSFRTRKGMEAALQSRACDLIGIGRPACILPRLPKEIIFNEENISDDDARLWLKPVPIPFWARLAPWKGVGAGIDTLYYTSHGIHVLGKGDKPVDNRL